jgi:hypothetical protein
MARQSLREVSQFVDKGPFLTPHILQSRHFLFFTRLNRQSNSNAKPSQKDHDLAGI